MKVIIPVLGFGKSGGYRVLSRLADELIEQGVKVSFLSPIYTIVPHYPTKATIIWVNKKGKVRMAPTGIPGNYITHFLSVQKGLKTLAVKTEFDIVFANHSLTLLPIIMAGLKCKIVYYAQAYEPEYYYTMKGLKNYLFAKLSEFSYRQGLFTIVNAEIYLKYEKLESSRVLYPGIDFNLFYPCQKTKINKDLIILGTIGRSESFKGLQIVLEAFEQLKEIYPNIELHIAFGDQKQLAGVAGIKCVYPANDKELGDFYRSLDIYLSAGYIQHGAFHYPVAESMSCGIPLITTPYFPADDSNAWIIKPKNFHEIVSQVKEALNNSNERNRKTIKAIKDVSFLSWSSSGQIMKKYLEEKMKEFA